MSLPAGLRQIRASLRTRLERSRLSEVEAALLVELDALDERLGQKEIAGLRESVIKMTGPGSTCPCCGR